MQAYQQRMLAEAKAKEEMKNVNEEFVFFSLFLSLSFVLLLFSLTE